MLVHNTSVPAITVDADTVPYMSPWMHAASSRRIARRRVIGRMARSPFSVAVGIVARGQGSVHRLGQHGDLGTADVVDIARRQHMESRIEVDHADRTGVVDVGARLARR